MVDEQNIPGKNAPEWDATKSLPCTEDSVKQVIPPINDGSTMTTMSFLISVVRLCCRFAISERMYLSLNYRYWYNFLCMRSTCICVGAFHSLSSFDLVSISVCLLFKYEHKYCKMLTKLLYNVIVYLS